jgi:RNA polymerase sigma factor (sigma-70 family)
VAEDHFPNEIREHARAAWHRYIDFFAPFRPELYRYCRRLSGNAWDAEDLVQETMLNGFGVLGRVKSVASPRGYLVRIATNLWLDAVRRRQAGARAAERERGEQQTRQTSADPLEVRDAAVALMQSLGPQLMLDTATIDMVGNLLEVGRKQLEMKGSWLWHAVSVHSDLPPELRPNFSERVMVESEPMMLGFIVHGDAKILIAIARFEEVEGRIAKIRSYNFSPELLQEVGSELGYTVGQVPYRRPASQLLGLHP